MIAPALRKSETTWASLGTLTASDSVFLENYVRALNQSKK